MNRSLATTAEVAEYLAEDERTLEKWRYQRRGPRWIKMGDGRTAPVRYRWSDVEKWLDERTVTVGGAA
ncbi:helix-turn-helix transcriptional regulator [Nonomuraea sp. NPDC049714]|uniref:helix-turn-helix transcriptional regulator n=1 Tax=Nonomuraea sp. NPDC049714 TaxID=3364357 RepID=UPI0037988B0A